MRIWCAVACVLVLSAGGLSAQDAANPVVVIQTNMGDITIELFRDRSPRSVANFLDYANSGFYAGTIFHRVIRGFMIQGGGLTPQLRQKPTKPPIPNEANNGLKNVRGTVAMARTSGIETATSQFFINTADNPPLNHRGLGPAEYGYAVFGRVVAGMDIVDKIERVKTNNADVPESLVMITGVLVKGS